MKTKTKLSFQNLLDQTGRKQYTDKDVVEAVKSCEAQELEFFTVGKLVTDDQLEAEYASRGFAPAHPYALALYAKEHPEFADEKYIGTHWKDAAGKWCFATFDRWYDERLVRVRRRVSVWRDRWWFAGVRKSTLDSKTLTPNPESLKTLSLPKKLIINGVEYIQNK